MNLDSRVPVSEQDKQMSYFKYYGRPMTQGPPEKYGQAKAPLNPMDALAFKDRNRLFEPGYLAGEVGWCIMPDGTGYLANLTQMPGVTTEMFDWWFAWHGLNDLRYSIWDPEDHYFARTMQRDKALDPDLSLKEKYWDTTHHVLESVGMGPEELFINFKRPGDLGFDQEKIGTAACSTIVCAKGSGKGHPPFANPDTIMCHFVREIEGGIELRSRFWMGWSYDQGKDLKMLPDGVRMPPMGPMSLLLHNIKEFSNLATLLPLVYAEEKDNW